MAIDKATIKKRLLERKLFEAEGSPELIAQIRKILADNFLFYFKAHSFHWNVEGENFNDYHAFFATIYTQTHAVIDPLAEHIRMLGEYAPNSLKDLIDGSGLSELTSKPGTAADMFRVLQADNNKLIAGLKIGRDLAEKDGITDLANYFDELLTAQRKLGWMLNALLK